MASDSKRRVIGKIRMMPQEVTVVPITNPVRDCEIIT
jgi:hypothetical protein